MLSGWHGLKLRASIPGVTAELWQGPRPIRPNTYSPKSANSRCQYFPMTCSSCQTLLCGSNTLHAPATLRCSAGVLQPVGDRGSLLH